MRQAGILAAAGLRRARARWSTGWPTTTPGPAAWPRPWPTGSPARSIPHAVDTNIVVFRHDDPAAWWRSWRSSGVLARHSGGRRCAWSPTSTSTTTRIDRAVAVRWRPLPDGV